jgi:hypothetical protein
MPININLASAPASLKHNNESFRVEAFCPLLGALTAPRIMQLAISHDAKDESPRTISILNFHLTTGELSLRCDCSKNLLFNKFVKKVNK